MSDGRSTKLRGLDAVSVGAAVFIAAGLCTCATLLIDVSHEVASVASLFAGPLTLAGLLILGFGASDERPLRAVPAAQVLLLVAAVAGVVQTTALRVRVPDVFSEPFLRLVVPGIGVVGGTAVGVACILLAVHRARRVVPAAVFVGLGLIAISALVTNGTALLADRLLLAAGSGLDVTSMSIHLSVLGSGIGLLVIAAGLIPSSRTAPQGTARRPR